MSKFIVSANPASKKTGIVLFKDSGMCRLVIGIDPDAQKSGIAIYKDGVLEKLEMWSFADILTAFRGMSESKPSWVDVVIVLEDVEAIRTTFLRKGQNPAAMRKIAQNVGQVKQTARLIKEMAAGYCINIVMVKPLGGLAKSAKKNADLFKRLTGWEGRSNEDTRDAAMLALHYIRMESKKHG